ncbi:GMC oxidoreductase [Flagelloscypha sp. PMI_526]|nr:GMC oxidoreductase [Flagelloscypha sp. PMI_526]
MFWGKSFPTSSLADVSTPLNHEKETPVSPKTFDYIIVGGGAAGCVLARRLSEGKGCSVLVIDRGKPRYDWASRVPLISRKVFGPDAPATFFESVPAAQAGGALLGIVKGKGLGGTTLVNGTMWTRPVPAEFEVYKEKWAVDEWSWSDVLPAFKKSETALSPDNKDAGFRGKDGEFLLSLCNWRPIQARMIQDIQYESYRKVYRAAHNLNIPEAKRANDPSTPLTNITFADMTVDSSGYRSSASAAYLPPKFAKAHKESLTVLTETIVTALDVQSDDDGKLFVAGVFLEKDVTTSQQASTPQTFYIAARHEVICSAGAISTPQLLQVSGIGPRALLSSLSIPVHVDLPVGQTFQDHINIPLIWSCPLSDSVMSFISNPLVALKEFFKYMVLGTGLFLGPFPQTIIWISSKSIDETTWTIKEQSEGREVVASDEENIPDLEFMIIALPVPNPRTGKFPPVPAGKGGFTILVSLIHPTSTGSVHINSTNPRADPSVDLAPFSSPADVAVLKKGVRLGMRMGQEMQKLGYPMSDFQVPQSEQDADLETFIRTKVESGLHFAASCPMGAEGVVDEKLRVKGVKKLRVADASVFPRVPAAHTMAPTVMIGERCADFLREEH